jgi:hypothetical protein
MMSILGRLVDGYTYFTHRIIIVINSSNTTTTTTKPSFPLYIIATFVAFQQQATITAIDAHRLSRDCRCRRICQDGTSDAIMALRWYKNCQYRIEATMFFSSVLFMHQLDMSYIQSDMITTSAGATSRTLYLKESRYTAGCTIFTFRFPLVSFLALI